MQKLQQFVLTIATISLFASCQNAANPKRDSNLADKAVRMETIQTITNSNEMMNEMMDAILDNNNAKMVMQKNEKMVAMMMENRDTTMKVLRNNPVMMQYMMSDMMEISKTDSSMMAGMCKTMMGNPQMMNMMSKMKGGKMDMNKMEGMKHKM